MTSTDGETNQGGKLFKGGDYSGENYRYEKKLQGKQFKGGY